jgi:hypothetical protein
MREFRNAYKMWVGEPERKDHLEDLSIDGKLLECIFGEIGRRRVYWMHLA